MADRKTDRGYRRIATEEAWCSPELFGLFRKELAERTIDEPGFHSLYGFFVSEAPRAQALVIALPSASSPALSRLELGSSRTTRKGSP